MKSITTIEEMQRLIHALKAVDKTIGFVPTMGYLHEGHEALLNKAREESDILILSIFVNPLQFGAGEDLDGYPRNLERDKLAAEKAGVDFIFHPNAEEMYPKNVSVKLTVEDRTDVLCGRSRPGHFDGVVTVLTKLFHIILPNRVYFGLKDAQQLAVVEGLVNDLNFPVKIIPVATVREADGLAKSSRNVYLDPSERVQAKELIRSLELAKKMIDQGERNPEVVVNSIKAYLKKYCEAVIDYVEIYSYPELKPLDSISGKVIIALAVKFSKARLIDNIILEID